MSKNSISKNEKHKRNSLTSEPITSMIATNEILINSNSKQVTSVASLKKLSSIIEKNEITIVANDPNKEIMNNSIKVNLF